MIGEIVVATNAQDHGFDQVNKTSADKALATLDIMAFIMSSSHSSGLAMVSAPQETFSETPSAPRGAQ